jgi:hypothetical protein
MPYDQIDGIRYRSAARPGGTSYVLFFDNAQCADADEKSPNTELVLDRDTVLASVPLLRP